MTLEIAGSGEGQAEKCDGVKLITALCFLFDVVIGGSSIILITIRSCKHLVVLIWIRSKMEILSQLLKVEKNS